MPQHTKKTKISGRAVPRPDMNLSDDQFISPIQRPTLDGDRRKFVLDGYARGVSLDSLLRGSGFTAKQLFAIIGLDEIAERKTYERLTELQEKRLKP